jgi:predicted nucleic-acid-binding protein
VIGVDTNVLARLIVEDDPKQLEAAKRFFASRSPSDPAVISLVVVAELVWVLRNPYSFSLEKVTDLVTALLASNDFLLERANLVERAVALARESRVDIADCLICAAAADLGSSSTVTFDKVAARRIPGMELLK